MPSPSLHGSYAMPPDSDSPFAVTLAPDSPCAYSWKMLAACSRTSLHQHLPDRAASSSAATARARARSLVPLQLGKLSFRKESFVGGLGFLHPRAVTDAPCSWPAGCIKWMGCTLACLVNAVPFRLPQGTNRTEPHKVKCTEHPPPLLMCVCLSGFAGQASCQLLRRASTTPAICHFLTRPLPFCTKVRCIRTARHLTRTNREASARLVACALSWCMSRDRGWVCTTQAG